MTDSLEHLTASLADRYRIERELGAGGMATVYLAHDLKHDRKVAIKVLRPELAAVIGAERFLSEIKTTANLQHPHILPLFDSGIATLTAGDSLTGHDSRLLYYVMPYIEGESLRDRLTRDKQLSIADAVRIATEVAGALDYAHRRGIVHRDIKPENILLHDGRALVADFGIALAASKAGDSRMTQTGMSLGTPAYMSPEQAMGERDIGPRSDIYALGATTYEMLVGDPPFSGNTVQSIVAKVMTEKPTAPSRIRDTVPPNVEHAVLTALQKLPADRFVSAKEFSDALTATGVSGSYAPTVATSRPHVLTSSRSSRLSRPVIIAVAALISTAAVAAGWLLRGSSRAPGPTTYDAALPDSAPITFAATTSNNAFGTARRNLSISPTGDFVVYASRRGDSTQFWYRSLRDASSHPITGSTGGTGPRISPDGSRIAYTDGNRVMLLPIAGGTPRMLLDAQVPGTPEWVSNTELFVAQRTGSRFTWLDPEGGVKHSVDVTRPCTIGHWIPEDRQVICSYNGTASIVDPTSSEEWSLRVARPDGSPGALLAGNGFVIVDRAYVLYVSVDGVLHAAPYDSKRHLAGRSVALTSGVRGEALGDIQIDLAPNGTLVFAPGVNATVGQVVRLLPGKAPVPLLAEAAAFQRIDLSRDGRWLAAAVQVAEGQELRLYDLRDGQRRTVLGAELVRHPLWSPSGDRLLVATRDSTLSSILLTTPGAARRGDTVLAVQGGAALAVDPLDYPDEHTVLIQDWGTNVTRRFDPAVSPAQFDTVLTAARFPSIAPGGKHIVYQDGGASGVLVTTYPVAGRRWQVAADGVEPLWLSSTEILYRTGVSWYLTRINPATGEPLGPATLWGRDPLFNDTSGWSNRPSWDGGIIYVQGPAQVSASYLRVVPDWVAQMKAAVAAANK